MKAKKTIFLFTAVAVLIASMTSSRPVFADDSGPIDPPKSSNGGDSDNDGGAGEGTSSVAGEMGSAFDDVLGTIRGLGESVIKFLIFGGGVIFTVGFVYSAMTGTIGQAIGNQTGVSQSVVRGISVLFGFLFLLASFNIATYLAQSITEKAVGQTREWADFSALMADGDSVDLKGVAPEEVLQSAAIEGVVVDLADAIVKFMIGLGGIFFIIAIVRGAFDTQLGTLMGGANMASQGIMRAVGAVGAFLFLATAFALSQNLVQLLVPRLVGNISLGM